MLPQHQVIGDALEAVRQTGIPFIQVISRIEGVDLPNIGIDNEAAGRMVTLLISGMQRQPGTVAALCHSQNYGVHCDRLQGFTQFMERPEASHLYFKQASLMYDDELEIAKSAAELIRIIPDLAGLYVVGGDYGPLCALLAQSVPHQKLCLIGHELTAQSTLALKNGTISAIIDQAPETQARPVLDFALSELRLLDTEIDRSPIRFATISAENV